MRKYFGLLLVVCVLGISAAGVSAASTPDVTQTYQADPSVLAGMIVELKAGAANAVTPLPGTSLSHMLGVVVPINDAPLVLTSGAATGQQVLVANSGRHNLLVSNQSGAIKAGDYLTISALDGIGMKAGTTQTEVVAQAESGFDGHSNVLGSVPLKKSTGGSVTAAIGSITVNVRLEANPLYTKVSNNLPSFLSQTANSVANRHVNTVRVYLSTIVLIAALIITGAMLYGGVSSGVISIGRNPLAKRAIGRGLFQIIATSLIVFMAGVFAAYLILRF